MVDWVHFFGDEFPNVYSITVSSNDTDFNAYDEAVTAGWDESSEVTINITVNSGVTIGASSTSAYAFDTDDFGSYLVSMTLINNGTILGAGGDGGDGGDGSVPTAGTVGGSGGTALKIRHAIAIENNGVIAGGGGGGGGGQYYPAPHWVDGGGGGGGAGSAVGSGGSGTGWSQNGSNGTATTGGAYGAGRFSSGEFDPPIAGGGYRGGSGGDLGEAGESKGYAGGAAGKYVEGDSFVTWAVEGTRLGGSS